MTEFDPIRWLSKYRAKHLGEDHFSLCSFCKHFREDCTCVAFPKGIPGKYLFFDVYHLEKDPSQKGDAVFELSSRFVKEK